MFVGVPHTKFWLSEEKEIEKKEWEKERERLVHSLRPIDEQNVCIFFLSLSLSLSLSQKWTKKKSIDNMQEKLN